MKLLALADRLPSSAKDLRLNLSGLFPKEGQAGLLEPRALFGAIVTAALTSGNPEVVEAALEDASSVLTELEVEAARTAAAVMAQNNLYYRALHLMQDPQLEQLPARLRMQGLRSHGIDELTFELWSLVASVLNGCGMCLSAHARSLRAAGADDRVVQEALRVASVIGAVASVLRTAPVAAGA